MRTSSSEGSSLACEEEAATVTGKSSAREGGESPRAAADVLGDPGRLMALSATGLGPAAEPSLDRFARLVRGGLGVPISLVSLVDDERQVFPGAVGLPSALDEVRQTPLSHSFCQHVVTTSEPLVVEDTRTDPRVLDNPAIEEMGVIAYAGVPLVGEGGETLGSLCAIDHAPRRWTEEDLAVLADLGAACSTELRLRGAAQRARQLQSSAEHARHLAEESNDRLELLATVTQRLGRKGGLRRRLSEVAHVLVPALADGVVLELTEEEAVHRTAVAGRVPEGPEAGLLADWPEPTGRVLRGLADWVEQDGGRRLVLPLSVGGRRHGVLQLILTGDREPFSPPSRALIDELVQRLAVEIENTLLHGQQRRASEIFQRSLLQRPPAPPDLQIAVHYQPAAAHASVGGDWHDAFVQPSGATIVVIGDVSGHDIAAAAHMGQLRNLVRGTIYDRPDTPAEGLARVDRALAGLAVQGLATAVLVRVDPPDAEGARCLRWSNAGHLPPVLLSPEGEARLLETEEADLLLGFDPEMERHDHAVDFPVGSTLVLCTDGLVERRAGSIDTDLERLRSTLGELAGLAPEALRDAALERLLEEAPDDDVALVVLRSCPLDGV